jgi:hypothetical protein
VPLAWWLGWLSMGWLYVVGFRAGHGAHRGGQRRADRADPGGAARDRLVEAHAKNALASSGAEVIGPGHRGR